MRIVRNAMYNAGRTVRQIRNFGTINGLNFRVRNLCEIRVVPTTKKNKSDVAMLYYKQLRKRSGRNRYLGLLANKNFLAMKGLS